MMHSTQRGNRKQTETCQIRWILWLWCHFWNKVSEFTQDGPGFIVNGGASDCHSRWRHRFDLYRLGMGCFSPKLIEATSRFIDLKMCIFFKMRRVKVSLIDTIPKLRQQTKELRFASAKTSSFEKIAAVKTGDLYGPALHVYGWVLIRQLCDKYLWERDEGWDLLGGTVASDVLQWKPNNVKVNNEIRRWRRKHQR